MAAWAEQPRKRPSRVSQSGKILACLERGGWWTTSELLREVPSIVHSRIHELRDRYGLEIEHRTTGPGASGSEYRLAVLDADESAPLTSGSVPPMGSSASSATVSQAEGGVGPFIPPASRARTEQAAPQAVALSFMQERLW